MAISGSSGARASLHRRLTLFVLGPPIAGCLLYGLLLWRDIAHRTGPSVPAAWTGPLLPDTRDILLTRNEDDASPVTPTAPASPTAPDTTPPKPKGRELSLEELQAKGMPGDSDRLPGQPVWDASMWNLTKKTDPDSAAWPNTLAVCAIMKGEHPDDVVEWLKYHAWLGVDKVFLRENAKTLPESLVPRVQGMVDAGFLDIGAMPGPKHPLQNRWYNRCSKPDMAGAHSWVTFLDLDEFMVVMDNGLASKNPDLKGLLKSLKGNAGLCMQWVLFGSSGLVDRPAPGGPLAHYHKCTGELSYQTKCLANMYHAAHHMMVSNYVHGCTYKLEDYSNIQNPPVTLMDGTPLQMEINTPLTNPNNDSALGDSRSYNGHLNQRKYNRTITEEHSLVLFHYVTRSLEDYTTRKITRHSGKYANAYVKKYGEKEQMDLNDEAVMATFEHANGFDGTAPVCSSAQKARYASKCCSGNR